MYKIWWIFITIFTDLPDEVWWKSNQWVLLQIFFYEYEITNWGCPITISIYIITIVIVSFHTHRNQGPLGLSTWLNFRVCYLYWEKLVRLFKIWYLIPPHGSLIRHYLNYIKLIFNDIVTLYGHYLITRNPAKFL